METPFSQAQKISEKLKPGSAGKAVGCRKNHKIPELKEEAFHITKKLDLISRHSTTIQELYTLVTGCIRHDNTLGYLPADSIFTRERTVYENSRIAANYGLEIQVFGVKL